ncbi:hypothetical protein GIB67_037873 [Kingdonia uniflora]|uniref:Uncharacterized protein n=1 Tax=Kingdonia uniflora TaxID=39325 RepID=A0A7J7LGY5_9MAGN|nr:hypothetical protein GIB67_037873 [Kingdonia uniflora]
MGFVESDNYVANALVAMYAHCNSLRDARKVFDGIRKLGMGSALETLCGQAYGAGKLDMLGIYTQRSWVIHLLTGKLSIWMIPQLFAYALNFPMQKFLQAQSKVIAMMWISFGVLVFHSFLSWLCIRKLDMGLLGAALTLNLSWWLMVFGQLAYILLGSFKESWTGFSWLAFADLSGFVRLFCFSCDALLGLLGIYGVDYLSGPSKKPRNTSLRCFYLVCSQLIEVECINVKAWFFMVPLGFMAAISVRVSNELGAGNPRAVKFSVWVMVSMSLITQTTFVIIILVTRNDYLAIFTDDKLVITVLEWASKQGAMMQDELVASVLPGLQ